MGFKLEQARHEKGPITKTRMPKTPLLEREVRFGRLFSGRQKEDFYTELSVLVTAGITLKEALDLIAQGQRNKKLQSFFMQMSQDLLSGKSLSDTVADKPEFSQYEYHSLKIGEESGTLPVIAKELGDFFARKNEQRRNLINALTYPVIILVTAVLVVVFMLRLVVPMFQDIFKQNGVDLPWITRRIIDASDFLKHYGWGLFAGILTLIVLRRFWLRDRRIRRFRDFVVLRVPYVGSFVKAVYLAQFTRALSLLTASRVPLLTGIELAGKMIGFIPLQEALEAVCGRILIGDSLSESLKSHAVFDAKMVALVKVAEETNQTELIFDRLNQQYSIEVQQKSKMLSTLLEPAIILVVGILVGIILIAMYLPMFKLGSVLG